MTLSLGVRLSLVGATALTIVSTASAQVPADRVNRGLVTVITGGVDSTAARMGAELADVLDDGQTRRVLAVVGKGSLQNVTDLRALRGIDMAILQTDVLQQLRDQRILPNLDQSFTYIAKLYSEELHVLAGEPVRRMQDLAGKKVNFGPLGSSASVTATALFRMLNIPVDVTSFDQATAVEKVKNGEIAALAVVAGKPAPAFLSRAIPAGMHFLPVPLTPDVLGAYLPASLTAEDYPGLVPAGQTVDTIAVGTALAVANLPPDSERYRNTVTFVDAFFTQFSKLQESARHPKWREVNLAAEMPNWRRFGPAQEWLKRNASTAPAPADRELKDIFTRFLDERARLSGGQAMTEQRKNELFEQFQRWQNQSQAPAPQPAARATLPSASAAPPASPAAQPVAPGSQPARR